MIEIKKIKLDTAALDKFAAGLGVNTDRALAAIAHRVEAIAKPLAPHDTGALRDSIIVERKKEGEYWVQDGVEYGIFWELGFHQSIWGKFQMLAISQKPFMVPAVEQASREVAREFEKALK
jgi:hypothetical protein